MYWMKTACSSDDDASTLPCEMKAGTFFNSQRDLIVTPAIIFSIWGIAALCTCAVQKYVNLGFADWLLVFWLFQTAWALAVLKFLRAYFPLKEGTFSIGRDDSDIYRWKIQAILCVTNLSFQFINALLPPIFRQGFYTLLGADIGPGIVSIGGRIMEPSLVSIGPNAIIGDDAMLLPHALSTQGEQNLILARIRIGAGAVIGAKSMIMPGVTVGDNAMVKAMSLVTRNTKIPAGEIWGGIPARKMGESLPAGTAESTN